MDPDLILILGLILAGLALVSVISAMSDGRGPRASIITVLIAGGMVIFALQTKPGGYTIGQLPDVFFTVIARFIP